MNNPFLEESSYNPVHEEAEDLELDELGTKAGRDADNLAEMLKYLPDHADWALPKLRKLRARQIALLAAFYIESELNGRKLGDRMIADLLNKLESETCPADCGELRELVAEFCKRGN